jgi:hypothetical protein
MRTIKMEKENDTSITFDWPASWPRILIPVDLVATVIMSPLDLIYYLFDLPTPRDVGPNIEKKRPIDHPDTWSNSIYGDGW